MPDANGKPLRADTNTPNPVLSNSTYDLLQNVILLVFPAAVVLYSGLGMVFGWPDVDEWVAAMGLIGTFLGVLLKVAQARYKGLPVQYDGELIANDPDPEKETYRLDFDNSLLGMANQKDVRLKVINLLPQDE